MSQFDYTTQDPTLLLQFLTDMRAFRSGPAGREWAAILTQMQKNFASESFNNPEIDPRRDAFLKGRYKGLVDAVDVIDNIIIDLQQMLAEFQPKVEEPLDINPESP